MRQHDDSGTALAGLARSVVPLGAIDTLHVVMGRQCNVRCEFCYQTSFSPREELAPDALKSQILPFLSDFKGIIIQGGEPTVMKSCKLLREHLRQIGYDGFVSFVTNGMLFKDEWIDFMVNRRGPGEVNFSINGSRKQVYDDVIKYGDFDAVMNNLRRMIALKRAKGKNDLTVRVSFVIYDKNMWDVLDFCNMFLEIGADKLVFFLDGRGSLLERAWSSLSDAELLKLQTIVRNTISTMESHGQYPSEISTLEYMITKRLDQREVRAA